MRCPHCAGEIPAGARFCGICGRGITPLVEGKSQSRGAAMQPAPRPARPSIDAQADSISLFELPTSRSARRARLALVLMLDAILAGAGVVMVLSYLDARREARKAAQPASPPSGKVVAPSPSSASAPDPSPPPTAPPSGREPGPAPEVAPQVQPASAPEPRRPAPKSKAKPSARPRPKSAPGVRSEAGLGMERSAGQVAGDAPEWSEGEDPRAELSSAAHTIDDEKGEPAENRVPAPAESGAAQSERRTALIRRVVEGHRAGLERCYLDAASSRGPGEALQGRIDIRFTLMTEGKATAVVPTGNTTGSGALADCVADLIRGWRFPPLSDPLTLEWPFLFRPPAESTEE